MANFQEGKNLLYDKGHKTTLWEEKHNCLDLKSLATQKMSQDLRNSDVVESVGECFHSAAGIMQYVRPKE